MEVQNIKIKTMVINKRLPRKLKKRLIQKNGREAYKKHSIISDISIQPKTMLERLIIKGLITNNTKKWQ